jgi:hypothetical protein
MNGLKTMQITRSPLFFGIVLASLALATQSKSGAPQKPSEKDNRQFSLLKGEMNGRPFFAIIASDLKTYPPKSKFPWFLSLSTPLIGPTADGLPQGEDFDALNAWEDEMETQVAKLGKYFYVGHVNGNGSREVLFYLEKPEPIVTALTRVRDSHSTRRFDFHCEKDKEWKKVSPYIGTVTADSPK